MMRSEFLDMSKITKSKHIHRLFDAIEGHGGTIRFVGGAVRDTLVGLSGFDLDLATDLSPDELVEACQDNYLKTIPIGLKMGTVGVLLGENIVEVSSLKRFIVDDNNKVSVEFTDDWGADAAQRDLTINAVYADLKGNVFDYYDGIKDLEDGRIRFIGDAHERIKEDPLRILRFFRFYSMFGKKKIDNNALEACIELKDLLRDVAIERVRDELFKLLITPNAAKVIKIIYDNEILAYFFPKSDNLDALQRLTEIVISANYKGDFLRRLFVLYQPNSVQAESIANILRFTKKQKETFINWAKINLMPENMATSFERRKFIYKYGKQFCIDKILLTVAIYNTDTSRLNEVLKEVENAIVPIFPIRGRDIINKGIDANHKVGIILNLLEQQWIDSNFTLTRDELLSSI